MLNTPFSPWPSYTKEEQDAVARTLASNRVNYWTGDECRRFEREFADWTGVNHAVALANGTLALELALRALGLSAGDEVIVTPRSFFASASCVVAVGATPVFADVDLDSQNVTAASIRAQLTEKTRAIICVHLAGMPCDMDPILALADEYGLKVIEDCAQAHGAEYRGRKVGSIGHIAAWSFCQDKIMSTGGEGGMITTDDEELWSKVWSLRDHGKSPEAVYHRNHPPGFRWLHESFGTNARMLEFQAVIGRIQLARMPQWHARRAANAARLRNACADREVVRVPRVPDDCEHAYYRFYAFVRPERLASGWSRDGIVAEINSRGVPCYHGACPEIYREGAFRNSDYALPERLPAARELGQTSIMMLVHPTLTDAEIDRSCAVLDEVLTAASA
jgi:dTDP-4-amino-4,6-dideoxygalactose transaminase